MTHNEMPKDIVEAVIDLGVEIDTHQDGDAFVRTFTFNDAQLEAYTDEIRTIAYNKGVEDGSPKEGTTLDVVTKWIKKFPRETILTVASSHTGLVITRTPLPDDKL